MLIRPTSLLFQCNATVDPEVRLAQYIICIDSYATRQWHEKCHVPLSNSGEVSSTRHTTMCWCENKWGFPLFIFFMFVRRYNYINRPTLPEYLRSLKFTSLYKKRYYEKLRAWFKQHHDLRNHLVLISYLPRPVLPTTGRPVGERPGASGDEDARRPPRPRTHVCVGVAGGRPSTSLRSSVAGPGGGGPHLARKHSAGSRRIAT